MVESIQDKLRRALQAADGLFYRLVLLVGESGSGKTAVLRKVANELGIQPINLNLALSELLLELTPKQRSMRLPELLDRVVNTGHSIVILDNLEILFAKELHQDPLKLLQRISRNRSVVASWNGTFRAGKLVYAETGHPEYRHYNSIEALAVGMDGTSTIDLTKTIKEAG